MIKKITLRFGRTPSQPALEFEPKPMTVFVGPNNSGKSKLLSELNAFLHDARPTNDHVLLNSINFIPISDAEIENEASKSRNSSTPDDYVFIGKHGSGVNIPKQSFGEQLKDPNRNPEWFCHNYLRFRLILLDGKTRMNLVREAPLGDLQGEARNNLSVLFVDDDKRKKVRQLLYEAFNVYFVLDPTHLGNVRIRFSDRLPANPTEEKGIHADAVEFHRQAKPIDSFSDGVKAYSGTIIEMVAGDPKIILMDEPEAFLHPSLAFSLGKETAKQALQADKRVFVSTHSPTFIMGCIHSGAPIDIIRLTYRNRIATARILAHEDLAILMRNPLLRSTGALSGLFYEAVIVTEGDTDRAFYQEVNERLLEFKPEWGIPNCLFLHAQNKQTVHSILKPLRELGIPAAAIVDIDILKEGGAVWADFLKGGFLPDIERGGLATTRAAINKIDKDSGIDLKSNGVNALNVGDRESANNLFDKLEQYGLFTVRGGELESWQKHLGIVGKKAEWLVNIFERFGEDSKQSSYIKPDEKDVWQFMYHLKQWLFDPARKGMPD